MKTRETVKTTEAALSCSDDDPSTAPTQTAVDNETVGETTDLKAISGNSVVNLSWNAPA